MRKEIRKGWILAMVAVFCTFAGGCGSKEQDEAAMQVMKITITPEPTPTAAPKEINPDAVGENGGVSMINQYVLEKSAGDSETAVAEETPDTDTLDMTEPELSEGGES